MNLKPNETTVNPVVAEKEEEYQNLESRDDVQIEESSKKFALTVVPETLSLLKKYRSFKARFCFSEQNEQYLRNSIKLINYSSKKIKTAYLDNLCETFRLMTSSKSINLDFSG